MRIGRTSTLAGLSLLSMGCASLAPSGYEAVTETSQMHRVVHSKGVMVGKDRVRSFDLPDGRVVEYRVTYDRTRVAGRELRRPGRYEVFFRDRPDAPRLRCHSHFEGQDGRRSRFACESSGGNDDVNFMLSPDVPGCGSDDHWRKVETDPRCWSGELETSATRYEVEYGRLRSLNAVTAQVVWRHETGAPVQAMDARGGDHAFELAHTLDRPAADRDVLLLHAVALQLWSHREVAYIAD